MTTNTQTIGQRIAHRLIDLRMSEHDLKKATSRSRQSITNWVTDKVIPDTLVLPSLARVLECNLEWLLTGEGKISRP